MSMDKTASKRLKLLCVTGDQLDGWREIPTVSFFEILRSVLSRRNTTWWRNSSAWKPRRIRWTSLHGNTVGAIIRKASCGTQRLQTGRERRKEFKHGRRSRTRNNFHFFEICWAVWYCRSDTWKKVKRSLRKIRRIFRPRNGKYLRKETWWSGSLEHPAVVKIIESWRGKLRGNCWSVMEKNRFIHRICETGEFVEHLHRENVQTTDTRTNKGTDGQTEICKNNREIGREETQNQSDGIGMGAQGKTSMDVTWRSILSTWWSESTRSSTTQTEIRRCDLLISILKILWDGLLNDDIDGKALHIESSSGKVHGRTLHWTLIMCTCRSLRSNVVNVMSDRRSKTLLLPHERPHGWPGKDSCMDRKGIAASWTMRLRNWPVWKKGEKTSTGQDVTQTRERRS